MVRLNKEKLLWRGGGEIPLDVVVRFHVATSLLSCVIHAQNEEYRRAKAVKSKARDRLSVVTKSK